jgi:hypothetical protein
MGTLLLMMRSRWLNLNQRWRLVVGGVCLCGEAVKMRDGLRVRGNVSDPFQRDRSRTYHDAYVGGMALDFQLGKI